MEFTKHPCKPAAADDAVLIGHPDWVRLPVELGDYRERVTKVQRDKCPVCGTICLHYILESYCVAECPDHAFLWYRRTETLEVEK